MSNGFGIVKVNEKLEKEYHRLIEKRKEIENQLLDYIEKEENVHKQQSDIEAEKIKIEAETNAKKKLLIQFSDEDKTFEAETKILLETAENLETKIEQAEKDSEQLTTDISEINNGHYAFPETLGKEKRVNAINPYSGINKNGSVAQLNRALDYGSRGSRFESLRNHFY